MSGFIVEGRTSLKGSIRVSGNKNEALPLIAASLLSCRPVTLNNVPDIGDVRNMLEIASELGAKISPLCDGSVTIEAPEIRSSELPIKLSSTIRASILFASSLLVRTGKAVISQPGGDMIGRRRMDTHFLVFKALGADLRIERKTQQTNFILETSDGLKGADIYLDEASVTATENALIAAAGAKGTTIIANAASEPHVQGLCRFLEKLGVEIEGIGSNVLKVHGSQNFGPVLHDVGSDYIEAGSFIGLAAATRSPLTITGVDLSVMRMILFQFERIGVEVVTDAQKGTIFVPEKQPLKIKKDLGGAIPRIEDSPWPGFPTDLLSILLVTATQSEGTCLVHEKMFESRLFFVDKLIGMGAQIVLCDPHRAVIVGPSPLYGSTISSPDIRAGMALLIAACAAEGRSVIYNIEQIDRGYERMDQRLASLGASVERINERRKNFLPTEVSL
ncbi:MAG TPA: UDP-N-acetylglucosamine 1-carboxyvinyltransferase [Chitinispirillaceae bacterium]|jgi:UDP-N-acetylglucosamine 1-carboxyvinyltransferase|nr:UDP-N-acetylglucosamine 1-carboxyvinyltransferase [Chitinispirillaceae bacterium]